MQISIYSKYFENIVQCVLGMTQVTYLLIQPVTASPLKKYFEFTFKNIFEIFRNLKYFEIYCEMFRNILHMRNLSKDFACSQDLSKDCATINLLIMVTNSDSRLQ